MKQHLAEGSGPEHQWTLIYCMSVINATFGGVIGAPDISPASQIIERPFPVNCSTEQATFGRPEVCNSCTETKASSHGRAGRQRSVSRERSSFEQNRRGPSFTINQCTAFGNINLLLSRTLTTPALLMSAPQRRQQLLTMDLIVCLMPVSAYRALPSRHVTLRSSKKTH